ncbi:orotidine 5'-phosphate decarboxylase [Patescibacteria group bacterium]|nr:orotidine 5'-phosphate decarboxylase [Patescibacteria group bacterium]
MKPLLFVALDGLTKRERETLEIAEQLSEIKGNFGFKVNLDYLLKRGVEDALENVQQFGRPVFTDLKMWNGRRTMTSVIENLVNMGVDYLNVYALADDLLPEAIQIVEGSKTKVLALTVLTHYTEGYCQEHFYRSFGGTVRHFAEVAIKVGCHGIILPGTTLEIVRDLEIIKTVPGIRPEWYEDTRHKQIVTPGEAIRNGADIIVVGIPITKTKNPSESLEKILVEME